MFNVESTLTEINEALEKAETSMKALKDAKLDDEIDERALAVALTQLETARLWLAKARK